MIKRLLIAVSILLLLAVAAGLTLPWWLGTALRGPAAERGLTFDHYERVGYGRWALTGVVYERPGLQVEADRIEAPHPLALWWRGAGAGEIMIGPWRGQSTPSAGAGNPAPRPPWAKILDGFDAVAGQLPPVQAAAGSWTLPNGRVIEIEGASFDAAGVQVRGLQVGEWTGALSFDRAARELRAILPERAAELRVVLADSGDGLTLAGTWRDHELSGEATFPVGEWTPRSARVTTGEWTLGGAEVGLTDYYARVTAWADATWRDGRFAVEAQAQGEPVPDRDLPPLELDLQAEGSPEEVLLQALTVSLPGLTAALDEPVRFDPRAAGSGVRSRFQVEADLAALPWGEQRGELRGVVDVMPRDENWPRVEGELAVNRLVWKSLELESAQLAGELTWPTWRLTTARLRDAAGSAVDLSGEGRLGDGAELDLAIEKLAVVRDSVATWVPDALRFALIEGQGRVAGNWPDLRVSGELAADAVGWTGLHPVDLHLDLTPLDDGETAAELRLTSANGLGRVNLSGGWRDAAFVAEAATLQHDETVLLQLQDAVTWAPGQPRLKGLRISGALGNWTAAELSATRLEVSGQGEARDLAWLRDWLAEVPDRLPRIENLDANLTWTPDSLRAALAGRAELELDEVGPVVGRVRLQADDEGLTIEQLDIGKGERDFASISGRLPLAWRDGKLAFDSTTAMQLNAVLAPNPGFWRAWGELTGVTVVGPDVQVKLAGSWANLSGEGRVKLRRLEVAERWGGVTWPVLTDLQSRLSADAAGLRIAELTGRIDSHEIRASGYLPLTREDWLALREDPLSYLRQRGEAHLEVPDADLASVARLVPDYLVPTGTLGLSLDFGGGGEIEGSATLRGAVTRPIGPLGVLQDVNADLSFTGRRIRFETVEAMMGGQRLALDGAVDWPAGEDPRLDLHLQGSNVPLVRSTGVLLRGDLDLSLRTDDAGETAVTGRVGLRDGLMLADVRSLVPSGGERQSRRPPYFSVEVAPFRDWRLDVAVNGRRFLRMRTPVLNGVASIEAQLEGTLLNPRAIGSVTLDEGVVKLPFATFNVEEAYARLSRASPYQPEIFLRGEGRRLGYDLGLELSGTASEPRLEMSSDPALPAEDVLLFVMAGVPPGDDATDVTTGQRSLQLGVYLGRELVGDLLGIEPSDRLTVTTGEQLSRRGKETYRFDYELNKRWTLTGEYDEFDYYNAGVRWRWYPWQDDEDRADGETEEEAP